MPEPTYADIESYIADGKTDAEIAGILEADPRTVRDIKVEDIRRYAIAEWGLLVLDPLTGLFTQGPLIELYKAIPPEMTAAKMQMAKFLGHLQNLSAQIVTTGSDPDHAAAWHQMEEQLALMPSDPSDPDSPPVLTPERRAILHDLHGGRKFAGVTTSDVTRVRRRHLLDSAILAAQSAFSRDEAAGDIEAAFAGELGGW